jgi:hypothetical protein
MNRRPALSLAFLLALPAALASEDAAFVRPGVPHPGGDQIYWVPTLVQAAAAARATGRPIFLMGYVASWDGW